MELHLVKDEKIAETSSKGNQEKWYDLETDRWYKVDQFGYEALSECAVSAILEYSNIDAETPFTFVRYDMEHMTVHGRRRTGCLSPNFLAKGQSVITLSRLLGRVLDAPLKEKLGRLSSDKKRIQYLAEKTAEYTGLEHFPEYLTLVFELDLIICVTRLLSGTARNIGFHPMKIIWTITMMIIHMIPPRRRMTDEL